MKCNKLNVLILGVNGMLGNTLFRYFLNFQEYNVIGICRNVNDNLKKFSGNIQSGVDVLDYSSLIGIFFKYKPDVVINCVGIIKQMDQSKNVLSTVPINSLFPHQLNLLCDLANSRLIHFSTDCVFSGLTGNYVESDIPDPIDLYGRSKLIGEVVNSNSSLTLRTSIIGHELNSNNSLLNWFLSSKDEIYGYKNAFFSGLTTLQVAQTLHYYIFPNPNISGLYHLASQKISKFELLTYISEVYSHNILIKPDTSYFIDRSLNCSKLKADTGYQAIPWYEQILEMNKFK